MTTVSTGSAITWRVAGSDWTFAPAPAGRPLIMGIVNTTPDSFSDGGQFSTSGAAVAHALKLVDEGADIIDIGGQSTRPGSDPVPVAEELHRVVPVVQALRRSTHVLLSIDTSKAEVARQAIEAGALIVNDVTALREDPAMIDVVTRSNAGIIIMHMQGTPKTMQQSPEYGDVVAEIRAFLADRLAALESLGVDPRRVAIDPGIGFGKTTRHNLTLIRDLGRFTDLGRPICLGASRKHLIGKATGRPVGERAVGSAAIAAAGYLRGAQLLRVHDVAATRDAVAVLRAVERGDVEE